MEGINENNLSIYEKHSELVEIANLATKKLQEALEQGKSQEECFNLQKELDEKEKKAWQFYIKYKDILEVQKK